MKDSIRVLGLGLVFLSVGCQTQGNAPAEIVTLEQIQPAGSEESLRVQIEYDMGSLEISSNQADNIYSLNLDYDKARFAPEIQYRASNGYEGSLAVKLDTNSEPGIGFNGKSNFLDLDLSNSLPVVLDITTGVGESRLSLSGMRLTRLDLSADVGGTKISVYEPNIVECEHILLKNGVGSMQAVGLGNLNFERLYIEGGVGSAHLDFSGEWRRDAEINIKVGVGGILVKMPLGIGVIIDADRHFLSGVHLDGFTKRGSLYYSEKYDESTFRVNVKVSTGIGGFRLTWI
jgi:hypothetical protein